MRSRGIFTKEEVAMMNLEIVTIEDSTEMYEYKNLSTVLNDGQVKGFMHKNDEEADIEIPLPDCESEQR